MRLYLAILSLLVPFFCFAVYLYSPYIAVLILLFVRSSLGIFQDFGVSVWGIKVNILYLYSGFLLLLGVVQCCIFRVAIPFFLKWYLLFGLWALITCIYAINKSIAVVSWLKVIAPFSMYVLVITSAYRKHFSWKNIILVVVFSSVFPIMYGLIRYYLGMEPIFEGVMRLRSTFILPNPYAFYLSLIGFPVCLHSPLRIH